MTVQNLAPSDPLSGVLHLNASPSSKKAPLVDSALEIPPDVRDLNVRVEISAFSTNKLHQFNAKFNSVLKSIRIADHSFAEIGTKLDQMTSEMQTFLKMYPPYPPDSKERVDLLKNYAAIRKQIEQLALPQDDFAGLLLGNGFADEASETYEFKVGDNPNRGQFINDPPKDGGGIILPELPMNAGDEQITETVGTLGKVKSHLTNKHRALTQVVRQLIEAVG